MLRSWSLLRGIQELGVNSPVVRHIRAGIVASWERDRCLLALISYELREKGLHGSLTEYWGSGC